MKLSTEYLKYELELARYDRDEAERKGNITEMEDAQCKIDNIEAELQHRENVPDAIIGKASER